MINIHTNYGLESESATNRILIFHVIRMLKNSDKVVYPHLATQSVLGISFTAIYTTSRWHMHLNHAIKKIYSEISMTLSKRSLLQLLVLFHTPFRYLHQGQPQSTSKSRLCLHSINQEPMQIELYNTG